MHRSSKLILIGGAVAALAVPAVASADAPRCQETLTTSTPNVVTTKTATFTATQPSGAGGNWVHTFNVTVKDDGTFTGSASVSGKDYDGQVHTFTESADGKLTDTDGDGVSEVTLTSGRYPAYYTNQWGVNNARMDGVADSMTAGTVSNAWAQDVTWDLPITFTAPEFKVTQVVDGSSDTTTTTTYKNHGDYVSVQGGGKNAAQSCVGMPLNSKQGSK